jgi:farnesyl-diphosphate farnesyltransferase
VAVATLGKDNQQLLKEVSRSFYLTIRILPRPLRAPIGLAYLWARLTDTIADTEILPSQDRLIALGQAESALEGASISLDYDRLISAQREESEARLLRLAPQILQLIHRLEAEDRADVLTVLRVISGGQRLDLERFSGIPPGEVRALKDAAELDDYTFRVAGCVGEFWTRVCRRHLFPTASLDEQRFLAEAIQFGKGLQMVNILRDLPKDLEMGRCYLPLEDLRAAGLEPIDLKGPGAWKRFEPVYRACVEKAEGLLASGWHYTLTIPRGVIRVRLACAWPILIGSMTLKKLVQAGPRVLEKGARVKVSRSEVRQLIFRSIYLYPFRHRWEALGSGV